MNKIWQFAVILAIWRGLAPAAVSAQSFDVVGSRAAGMGGAFVGVADDASAVYWNPAGLAAGSYFSLVLDGGVREAVPEQGPRGSKQSTFFMGATMPALGFSYYRLRNAVAVPDTLVPPAAAPTLTGTPYVRVDTLVTNNIGLTFVQSVFQNLAIGSTLKVVRGVASTRFDAVADADAALDLDEPEGEGTTRVDLDFGVMFTGGRMKAGVCVRNLREPEFTSPEGRTLTLERQARAGVSYLVLKGLTLAADLDLLEADDAFGQRRDAAFGLEARLASRAWFRSGLRFNTADTVDDLDWSDKRAFTFGGTFAATASVMVDGLFISGGDKSGHGWGVSARFVY